MCVYCVCVCVVYVSIPFLSVFPGPDDECYEYSGGRQQVVSLMREIAVCLYVWCYRYGGILLHGDRFKHINNVARTLLQETGIGLEVT